MHHGSLRVALSWLPRNKRLCNDTQSRPKTAALVSCNHSSTLLVGSIANLIVVEAATRLGVTPSRRGWANEHWRTGVPITLLTLAIAAGWLWLRHEVLAR